MDEEKRPVEEVPAESIQDMTWVVVAIRDETQEEVLPAEENGPAEVPAESIQDVARVSGVDPESIADMARAAAAVSAGMREVTVSFAALGPAIEQAGREMMRVFQFGLKPIDNDFLRDVLFEFRMHQAHRKIVTVFVLGIVLLLVFVQAIMMDWHDLIAIIGLFLMVAVFTGLVHEIALQVQWWWRGRRIDYLDDDCDEDGFYL